MKNKAFLQLITFSLIMALLLTTCSVKSEPPKARAYHVMAYDSESRRMIMYGGQTGNYKNASSYNYETWSFDPATNIWKKMAPAVVPGGNGGEMAYDSRADRVIMVVLTDPATPNFFDYKASQTWAYDYNTDTWTKLGDGPSGKGRIGGRIVYDSKADKIILFGGVTVLGENKAFNETWVYDYNSNTWTQMQPNINPEPRNFQGMAYDPKSNRTIVWGGSDFAGPSPKPLWSYDYNTNSWEEIKYDQGPTARDYNGFMYNEKTDRFILYGGFIGGTDETWVYDLNSNTWQQMQPTQNPGKLSRHGMVYSPDTDKVILFGGQIGNTEFYYSANTWIYDPNANTWTDVTPKQ